MPEPEQQLQKQESNIIQESKVPELPHIITMTREGSFLYFILPTGDKDVRYDLKQKTLQKFVREEWKDVNNKRCFHYFRNYSVNDLVTNQDTKFLKLISTSKRINKYCKSISTFLHRMGETLHLEQYDFEGIRYLIKDPYRRSYDVAYLKQPLSIYDKHVLVLIKKARNPNPNWEDRMWDERGCIIRDVNGNEVKDLRFTLTVEFENKYVKEKPLLDAIAKTILTMNLDEKDIFELLEEIYTDNFLSLIKEFNYEPKALVGYLVNYLKPFENQTIHAGISQLHDYYSMGFQIGRKLKKYPKYLRSMHDIIMANYQSYKKDYDQITFQKKIRHELEYKGKFFCIVNPSNPQDIIIEGTNLNHCVSSYVDRIIKGDTYICFLRIVGLESDSLVTLEVIGKELTQARGSYNRNLSEEEKKFLKEFCQKKEIKLVAFAEQEQL